MKILDRAARLEKAVLDRLARRTDLTRHPLEIYGAILDDIEEATEPGARGTRMFPYNEITVTIAAADAHHRATAEAVFAESPSLAERARTRLRHAGCAGADAVNVTLKFVAAEPQPGREYAIAFRRRPATRQTKPSSPSRVPQHELHAAVIAGAAFRSRYSFTTGRINIGRLADVVDRQQRIVRKNQIVFVDGDDAIGQSVSRAHAHITFDPATGDARLHDDGSTHGTHVVRGGRTLAVPRGGGRGLKLQDGDEVQLGQARLRVEVRRARKR